MVPPRPLPPFLLPRYNAPCVLVVDIKAHKVRTIPVDLAGGGKWSGGVLAADGSVWGVPHNAGGLLRVDPKRQTAEVRGIARIGVTPRERAPMRVCPPRHGATRTLSYPHTRPPLRPVRRALPDLPRRWWATCTPPKAATASTAAGPWAQTEMPSSSPQTPPPCSRPSSRSTPQAAPAGD